MTHHTHTTTPMRIGGQQVTTEDEIPVRSPYDDQLVGHVPAGQVKHLDAAVAEARAVLASGPLPAWRRAEILDNAAAALERRQEEFAQLICAESAKPIRTARAEAQRGVSTLKLSAVAARTMTGELVPLDAAPGADGRLGYVRRVPRGVVAAITPFNFPLNLVLHKVGPAIAAGCPIVVKPAPATPLTALRLADLLLDEAGLPPGWLNVVTCTDDVAPHLVDHPDVAMITFTGSREVGWAIRTTAPKKTVSLELGNNSPVIVEPDADVTDVARRLAPAGFGYAGQVCISAQRLYVHRDVVEEFTDALVEATEQLQVGPPAEESTDVSVLITAEATARVQDWIDEAVRAGARIATGGTTVDGIIRPTVLTEVTPAMRVCADEVFGPVLAVQAYDTWDEAIALANDTPFGLQAAVFTSDLGKALAAADRLDFGGVLVNEVPAWRADAMPYGGIRESGNTREGPTYAAREMTVERLVVLRP